MDRFIIITVIATIALLIFSLFISKVSKKKIDKYIPSFIVILISIPVFIFIKLHGSIDGLRDLGIILLTMINFIAGSITLLIVGIIELINYFNNLKAVKLNSKIKLKKLVKIKKTKSKK